MTLTKQQIHQRVNEITSARKKLAEEYYARDNELVERAVNLMKQYVELTKQEQQDTERSGSSADAIAEGGDHD